MKTFSAKAEEVRRDWFIVDATDKTLGRLCSELARRLRGKHKPVFTPYVDTGDYLIVVNAEKIAVTGNKLADKKYHRFTGYIGNLTGSWIPALDGVEAKLRAGIRVADIGCGHGASTILMAQAYPASQFIGFDYHDSSIETARKRAEAAGISNVRFAVADATSYDGGRYDLIAFFDSVHDMADPAGAARHARQSLAADGQVMLVEPFAKDRLEENLNPVGRLFYAASTFVCTPNSLSASAGGVADSDTIPATGGGEHHTAPVRVEDPREGSRGGPVELSHGERRARFWIRPGRLAGRSTPGRPARGRWALARLTLATLLAACGEPDLAARATSAGDLP